MEIYSTNNNENKNRETLRRFFLNHSMILIIGVVLGIAAMFIWRYLHYHHNIEMTAVSISWDSLQTTLSGQANQVQLEAAKNFANTNDNHYGALTFLEIARQYANIGDFSDSQTYLKKALDHTHEGNLQAIIYLRLAQIQLQQNNVDDALKTLNLVKGKGWIGLVENIRGDAHFLKGDYQAARTAYEKSLSYGASKELVRMKINELSS